MADIEKKAENIPIPDFLKEDGSNGEDDLNIDSSNQSDNTINETDSSKATEDKKVFVKDMDENQFPDGFPVKEYKDNLGHYTIEQIPDEIKPENIRDTYDHHGFWMHNAKIPEEYHNAYLVIVSRNKKNGSYFSKTDNNSSSDLEIASKLVANEEKVDNLGGLEEKIVPETNGGNSEGRRTIHLGTIVDGEVLDDDKNTNDNGNYESKKTNRNYFNFLKENRIPLSSIGVGLIAGVGLVGFLSTCNGNGQKEVDYSPIPYEKEIALDPSKIIDNNSRKSQRNLAIEQPKLFSYGMVKCSDDFAICIGEDGNEMSADAIKNNILYQILDKNQSCSTLDDRLSFLYNYKTVKGDSIKSYKISDLDKLHGHCKEYQK